MTSSPGSEAEAAQDGLQGHRAVGHEDGMADAAVLGPRLLELPSPLAHGQHARVKHLHDAPSSAVPTSGREIGIMLLPPRIRHRSTMIRSAIEADNAAAPSNDAPDCDALTVRKSPATPAHPTESLGWVACHEGVTGTARVTTAPAPTVANGDTSQPATTTAAGADRAALAQVDLRDQSSAPVASDAVGGDAPGNAIVREDRPPGR